VGLLDLFLDGDMIEPAKDTSYHNKQLFISSYKIDNTSDEDPGVFLF
jgi:hypothetical protein